MASKVGIANHALTLIGERTINSFEDGTAEANFVSRRYDDIRDELLRQHNWGFATKRQKLAQSATAPVFEYDYAYQLPSDFIRSIAIYGDDGGNSMIDYRVVGETIQTSSQEVWMTYVGRVDDPNQMPVDFRSALAYMLAYEGTIALSDNSSLRDRLAGDVDNKIRRARSSDGMGDSPTQLAQGSWINRRWGSGGRLRKW